MFLVADQRCVDHFGANFAKMIPADPNSLIYVRADSAPELQVKLQERLDTLELKHPFKLSDAFGSELATTTLESFNASARLRHRQRLRPRQVQPKRVAVVGARRVIELPISTMHPLEGPLFAALGAQIGCE